MPVQYAYRGRTGSVELYFTNENVPPGMRLVYETLEGGIVDPNRYVPELGYVWDNFITPARDQLRLGAANLEDAMPIALEQANKYLQEARARADEKLDAVLRK